MQDASNALHVLILGEKLCLQCCSKLVITKRWVMKSDRQRVQVIEPTTENAEQSNLLQ